MRMHGDCNPPRKVAFAWRPETLVERIWASSTLLAGVDSVVVLKLAQTRNARGAARSLRLSSRGVA